MKHLLYYYTSQRWDLLYLPELLLFPVLWLQSNPLSRTSIIGSFLVVMCCDSRSLGVGTANVLISCYCYWEYISGQEGHLIVYCDSNRYCNCLFKHLFASAA